VETIDARIPHVDSHVDILAGYGEGMEGYDWPIVESVGRFEFNVGIQ
jgi:hypothetical protein